jgi:long-chain acyl-CoA synthetase
MATLQSLPETGAGLPLRIDWVVNSWAERAPDRPALVDGSGSWTYRELACAVDESRKRLADRGIRSGDRVMIIAENCRALVAMLFATTSLDAWPVLANARLSAREIDQIRDHCGACRLIYTLEASPHAKSHGERHGAVPMEVPGLGGIGLGPRNVGAVPEPIEVDVAQNTAALIYTSGTTGRPKGVMLTHRNLLFVASVVGRLRGLTPADHVYGVLPISHAVGLAIVLLGTLLNGATLYLSPRFDPSAMLAALGRERVTVIFGTPAMFRLLVEYAQAKGLAALDCPGLRIMHTSGAPLDAMTKSSAERVFGVVLHQGYGTTECSPTIAQTRIDAPRTDTSVGSIIPGIEVKLVGTDGGRVGDGEAGELWVRGPNVMKGYYRANEETAAVIDREGWFNTRDLARFEGDNLFIVGRTQELILRFGFNVFPAEIEAVLSTYPGVGRCAVFGRAANGDNEIIACVSPSPGALITTAVLADHAANQLAPYKRPTKIVLVADLPTGPTGKILKSELVEMIGGLGLEASPTESATSIEQSPSPGVRHQAGRRQS